MGLTAGLGATRVVLWIIIKQLTAAKVCLFCTLLATEISSTYGSAPPNSPLLSSFLSFKALAGLRKIGALLEMIFLSHTRGGIT